mgnify:CR=1 FL=1
MLLSANELVYNKDAERVIVRGAVQINYGGYQMVAQQNQYSQKTGRIIATGEIELRSNPAATRSTPIRWT